MKEKHVHHECEIYYLLEGEGTYFIDSVSHPVMAGSLVIINKSQIHRSCFKTCDYHHRILVELQTEHFEASIQAMCGLSLGDFFQERKGVYQLKKEHQPYMKNLLATMLAEVKSKHQRFEVMIAMKLAELAIYLSRPENLASSFLKSEKAQTETSAIVTEAMAHIHGQLSSPLSLESIASHLFINKSYLSRVFKETTSMTVHEYINIQRVQEAKRLFETTDLAPGEIAQQIGYNTASYFERVFKKHTEVTPLKYQQRIQRARLTARPRNS